MLERGGGMFYVTRWLELPCTYNARGGAVPEWEVWGRPARSTEVAAAVAEAAARILMEAEQRESAGREDPPAPSDPNTLDRR